MEADKKALALTQALYETGVDNQISVVAANPLCRVPRPAATKSASARSIPTRHRHAHRQVRLRFLDPGQTNDCCAAAHPVGIPSQLLERRPDIAAAERNMASANAAVGVAYSAFFPRFTLSASGGFQSSSWKHLFDWPSRTWSLGVGATETILTPELGPGLNQFVTIYNPTSPPIA